MKTSLITRIFLLFALAMLLPLAASIYGSSQMENQRKSLELLNDGYLPLIKTITKIETIISNQENDQKRIFEVSEKRVRQVLTRLVVHYFPKLLKNNIKNASRRIEYLKQQTRDKDAHILLAAVEQEIKSVSSLQKQYEDLSREVFGDKDRSAEDLKKGEAELKIIGRDLSRTIKLISLRLEKQVSQISVTIERAGNRTISITAAMIGVSLLVAALVLALLIGTLRPIRRLTREARRISRGEYNHQVKLTRQDEIGLLAREFDTMRESLVRRDQELDRQREELIRSERLAAVGSMASHVTHEIRNPLSSISLNAEMLMDDLTTLPDAEDAIESLRAIIRETERLSAITEEYLTFARLPRGDHKTVRPADVIRHVVDVMKPLANTRNITMAVNIDNEGNTVDGNENQLIQALLNLVKNALEAVTDNTGDVRVSMVSTDTHIRLQVQDNGPGLPQDFTPERLFDSFFSTKASGTGLGLALCQSIARDHNAVLTGNTAPDGGAVFTFTIPRSS